ncbi:MAG: zinc-binding dehydrogenase [Acidimicrobiales bacterium]|nr:zinc-binding dehydrogenase [Acidimicrobiales bacterium]
MKALEFGRKPARYAAAMAAGRLTPGGGAKVRPLRLADLDVPALPGPGWHHIKPRLSGICGSDLSTIDGTSSRYFEPIVSFPFVPGHEVVADRAGGPDDPTDGTDRVVVEPVLGCVTRGISPVCAECAAGHLGNCTNITFGAIEPGLQSGFCHDTGGGWSTMMVAHESQLHAVPAELSDEAAVLVEPTACAVHGALAAHAGAGDRVVVLGAGTLGLLTIAALRRYAPDAALLVVAKHPHQRALAAELLGDAGRAAGGTIVEPGELKRAVRRTTGAMAVGDGAIVRLAGGADIVVDCVGSAASVTDSLAVVRPRGRIVVVGMPGVTTVDLTPLWHKEARLVGAYAYGTEVVPETHDHGAGEHRRTFDLAFDLVASADLDRLVSATYPLARYGDAITHAATAGPRGAVKVAFDLRAEKERTRL